MNDVRLVGVFVEKGERVKFKNGNGELINCKLLVPQFLKEDGEVFEQVFPFTVFTKNIEKFDRVMIGTKVLLSASLKCREDEYEGKKYIKLSVVAHGIEEI